MPLPTGFILMLAISCVQPPAVISAGKLSESAEPSPLKKMKTSFSHEGMLMANATAEPTLTVHFGTGDFFYHMT